MKSKLQNMISSATAKFAALPCVVVRLSSVAAREGEVRS